VDGKGNPGIFTAKTSSTSGLGETIRTDCAKAPPLKFIDYKLHDAIPTPRDPYDPFKSSR
jgi:hypothetical protein